MFIGCDQSQDQPINTTIPAAVVKDLGVTAGVVLSAASKCDTPNVKGIPPSHKVPVRPSTGEPKKQSSGQRACKADPPGRLQRTASAEAASPAAAASPVSRQSSAPPAALEAASAQVTAAHYILT